MIRFAHWPTMLYLCAVAGDDGFHIGGRADHRFIAQLRPDDL